MYTPTFDKYIDFKEEKNAIIEFCNKHWTVKDNKEDLAGLVDFLFDFGINGAKNKFNSIEVHKVIDRLLHAETKRLKLDDIANILRVEENGEKFHGYHRIFSLSSSVDKVERYASEHMQKSFNYDEYLPKLLFQVENQFPNLNKIEPIDWKKYLGNPESLSEYVKTDSKFNDFKGSISNVGQYVWLSFPEQQTLSYIQYSNERGRTPLQTLISSIAHQAYASQVHNNTVEMLNELNQIIQQGKINQSDNKFIETLESRPLKILFELGTYTGDPNDKEAKRAFKEQVLSNSDYYQDEYVNQSRKNKM